VGGWRRKAKQELQSRMCKLGIHYYKNDFMTNKGLGIFGGGRFHLRRRSQLTISQNAFTQADILFTETIKFAHLIKSVNVLKSIYGDERKWSLFSEAEADAQEAQKAL
jgi:hypothetical protein